MEAVRSTSASRGGLDDETVLSPGCYRAAAARRGRGMRDGRNLPVPAGAYIGHHWTL